MSARGAITQFDGPWESFPISKEWSEHLRYDEINNSSTSASILDSREVISDSKDDLLARKIIRFPRILPINKVKSGANFAALKEWEGVVTHIGEGMFHADLYDLSHSDDEPNEEMEFLIDELSEDEKARLKEGAIFRFMVGIVRHQGQRMNTYKIYFRRLNRNMRHISDVKMAFLKE